MDVKKTCWVVGLLLLFPFHSFASEAVGFYSKGSLREASSVFERSLPIQKLFVTRGKLYTTDEMHDLLESAAQFVSETYPESEVLQVGDLSGQYGGLAPRHSSHQNGLDADIVYLRHNGYVQSATDPEWNEYFVKSGKVTANLHLERNFSLFRHLVASFPVTRIFVDHAIKKRLCQYASAEGLADALSRQTLRRLRVANLHQTHFHVRLACPAGDTDCTPQAEPPQGTGCSEIEMLLESAAHKPGESC